MLVLLCAGTSAGAPPFDLEAQPVRQDLQAGIVIERQ
jgi:hypothetical protein